MPSELFIKRRTVRFCNSKDLTIELESVNYVAAHKTKRAQQKHAYALPTISFTTFLFAGDAQIVRLQHEPGYL
jgi:hypothetical protein